MNKSSVITNIVLGCGLLAFASCSTQEEVAKPKPAPAPAAKAPEKAAEKAPAKAKAEKVSGDVGLLDTEKNYLIIVTKDGKLVTLDFDSKAKATMITPTKSKISDIGLGSSATVTYTKDKDKNLATAVEFKGAKGE
jgi:hypothetical protein